MKIARLPISTKDAVKICKAIKGMKTEEARKFLESLKMKRKSLGGKYYVKAASFFLKELRGLPEARIFARACKAGKFVRSGRRMRRAKRTHLYIETKETK